MPAPATHRIFPAVQRLLPALWLAALALAAPAFAAEPAPTDSIDMSVKVGQALTAATDLIDAGKHDEAYAALQQLRAQPLNEYEALRVLQQIVNLDIMMGKYAEAITDHEALLQVANLGESERTSALLMVGKLKLQQEQWSDGLAYLLQANERQGQSSLETLYLIGFAYYRTQQPALALQYLEQAVAVGGAQAGEPHYSLLGVLYVDAKDYARAIAAYENLFSAVAKPTQAESYYSTLSTLYVQVGDSVKARTTLQHLINTWPNSAKVSEYRNRLGALN